MRCPFLREALVKSCRASAFKKLIVRMPNEITSERCSSADYIHCPAAKQCNVENPIVDRCPFLHESLMQYCGAAAVTKYIPYSESLLSQCGTDSHKYCELYLTLLHPELASHNNKKNLSGNGYSKNIEEVRVPAHLWYSSNHMWLNISEDGIFHIGIDGLLAKVLGKIDQITFLTTKGLNRPTVVLTIQGVDLQIMFPFQIMLTRANTYLRTNPDKIFSDPYTFGWLFEGVSEGKKETAMLCKNLITNQKAVQWMNNEQYRLTELVHQISSKPDAHGVSVMADGGEFQPGIAQLLSREELLNLFNDFFSPFVQWRI
ncbi:MAG: hypothetical protein H3C35_07470 [Bacteroidetes bacterium]|nr:hypothetical protein [Bacteroidota bacterium]